MKRTAYYVSTMSGLSAWYELDAEERAAVFAGGIKLHTILSDADFQDARKVRRVSGPAARRMFDAPAARAGFLRALQDRAAGVRRTPAEAYAGRPTPAAYRRAERRGESVAELEVRTYFASLEHDADVKRDGYSLGAAYADGAQSAACHLMRDRYGLELGRMFIHDSEIVTLR